MNTYRVIYRTRNRKHRYDVDAIYPGTAINRVLKQAIVPGTPHVDVTCRLSAQNIKRHYSDPWVRPA